MGMTDEQLVKALRDPRTSSEASTMRHIAADRIEQLNKNCEALSQIVDSVSESRDFWRSEYVNRCLYK